MTEHELFHHINSQLSSNCYRSCALHTKSQVFHCPLSTSKLNQIIYIYIQKAILLDPRFTLLPLEVLEEGTDVG